MNIGLVLSGGTAKGAYQVGALRAVSEYFQPGEIKCISAASIGALNAYAYASNEVAFAEEMWKSINAEKDKLFISTVLKDGYLENAIDYLTLKTTDCEKMYVPIFNLKERNNCYVDISGFETDAAKDHLNASVALFPICEPVVIENKKYYDGALIDNIPVFPLLKHDLDYIICIYFDEYNYIFESKAFDNRIVKITFDDNNQLISNSVWFSRENTEYMMAQGYKKAKSILSFVFSSGTENLGQIYSNIETLNSFNPRKQVRITGDVALNNLNKIAKRLTKRNIIE